MPYKIIKSGSGYKVAKKHGGKTFSKKSLSYEKAVAQLKAIEANTHNEQFDLVRIIRQELDRLE